MSSRSVHLASAPFVLRDIQHPRRGFGDSEQLLQLFDLEVGRLGVVMVVVAEDESNTNTLSQGDHLESVL